MSSGVTLTRFSANDVCFYLKLYPPGVTLTHFYYLKQASSQIWSRQWYTVFVLIMPIAGLSHRLTEPGVFNYVATGEVIVKLVNAYAVSATYAVSSALYFVCTAIQATFNILAMIKYNNYKQHNSTKENDKRLLCKFLRTQKVRV